MAAVGLEPIDEKDVGGKYEPEGFKADFVKNGQGQDVYRHVLFTAGNELRGPVGALENAAQTAEDTWQSSRADLHAPEAQTEVRDDWAGMKVGEAMRNVTKAGKSGDYAGLFNTIFNTLCDF